MKLLGFIHVYLRLLYGQLGGFVRMLSGHVTGLKTLDYSSMAWRIQRLYVKLDDNLAESTEEVVPALDASGVKVPNRGEWMVRRGHLKIHIAVDVKRQKVADGRRLRSLVREASKQAKIIKVTGDGGYERNRT